MWGDPGGRGQATTACGEWGGTGPSLTLRGCSRKTPVRVLRACAHQVRGTTWPAQQAACPVWSQLRMVLPEAVVQPALLLLSELGLLRPGSLSCHCCVQHCALPSWQEAALQFRVVALGCGTILVSALSDAGVAVGLGQCLEVLPACLQEAGWEAGCPAQPCCCGGAVLCESRAGGLTPPGLAACPEGESKASLGQGAKGPCSQGGRRGRLCSPRTRGV